MNAIRIEVLVDEPVALAVPALRPLVGKRVQLTAVETSPARKKTSFKDFVPYKPAPGVGPVSLEDMERAIVEGATKRARV
jgi:hypothetical protein